MNVDKYYESSRPVTEYLYIRIFTPRNSETSKTLQKFDLKWQCPSFKNLPLLKLYYEKINQGSNP